MYKKNDSLICILCQGEKNVDHRPKICTLYQGEKNVDPSPKLQLRYRKKLIGGKTSQPLSLRGSEEMG